MMDLMDRLMWLLLGCLIGFVLGYIVRSLQDIKEKVDEIDEVVTDAPSKWEPNERGFMRLPRFAELSLLLVIALTVWASFATARVNAQLNNTIDCITNYNVHQSTALKLRDKSIRAGTSSEIQLWTEYGKLYALAEKDPSTIPAAQKKLSQAVAAHRDSLTDIQSVREAYPYAQPDILKNCKKENQ